MDMPVPRTTPDRQKLPHREAAPLPEPTEFLAGLSIDNVIFGLDHGQLHIMLVKHDVGPGKGGWALPGGYIGRDENLRDAAARLLLNLTGVRDLYLRSEEHTSELQSRGHLVCRLLLEKKKN